MKTNIKITAAGDAAIARRVAPYEGFDRVKNFIGRGDARFLNLETTLHRGECFASQYSGGTWLRADPCVLSDILDYSFNMLSFANNHTMDFSYDGLLKTLDAVEQYGFVHSGVGRNLSEAAAPAYLDTAAGRIALISAVSTFNPAAMAGEQSRRITGRPGVNGIRFDEEIHITADQMEAIKRLAASTDINGQRDIIRAEGYLPPLPDGCFDFGDIRFRLSDTAKRVTKLNGEDMKRVEKAIYEAQLQADLIIVSIHGHEISGNSKENPAGFLKDFAHQCIDAGAHGVIGHGPHLLRPVEIYKNRPVLYSLGDFILQLENFQFAPEDFYAKFGLTSDDTVHDLLKKRTRDFTIGLMRQKVMMESVIPYMEFENGSLKKLELLPIELGFGLPNSRAGLPRPAQDTGILERLAKMSEPYGTRIKIENAVGEIVL